MAQRSSPTRSARAARTTTAAKRSQRSTRSRAQSAPAPSRSNHKKQSRVVVMIGTRKGAFFYRGNDTRREWQLSGPHFFGSIVNHVVQDPRDRRTLLAGVRSGHLGPTVFRSTDWGRTWKEASKPPAFSKPSGSEEPRSVQSVFWLTPGHVSQPDVWYAGTSPQGLFRSEDGGRTWSGVDGFNKHPKAPRWMDGPGTPDGPLLHSIVIDPRNADHMYLGMSAGGVFETRDGGFAWQPLNRGVAADFLPQKNPEFGHDPHCVVLHPAQPDRLYQQNHCGIYRLDRPETTWKRIGERMPKRVGDIGFPIVAHPRQPDTAWVFPMDGTEVWPRTSPDGRPAVYQTLNAGRSWKRQDQGLPKKHAWFSVKRQAMAADEHTPLGLYFGTTSGEVWWSRTEGQKWQRLAEHLPHIYSVSIGMRG